MRKYLTALTFAAVLAGGAAMAQPSTANHPNLVKYDTNGDGQLSEQEMQAAKAQLITTYDSNGDGQLSEAEKQAARTQLAAQAKSRLDTDGDGQVSEAEKQAARQRVQQRRGR